jgi:hypothetical protein
MLRVLSPRAKSINPGVEGRELEDDRLAAFPFCNVESQKRQLLKTVLVAFWLLESLDNI